MTEIADPSPTPPVAAPAQNPFARIAGVLFTPVSTFEDIARRPSIMAPLIVILLVGYVATFLILPRMDWDAVTAAQEEAIKAKNPNMSQEDMDRIAGVSKTMGKIFGWVGPVIGVVWYLIVAAVLLLAFRLMGGQGTFPQAFSATLYAWIPLVINGIVLAIVAIGRGSVDPMQMATMVKSNPAFLVSMKEQPVLFTLLASLDIFTIWTIVLLIIGFAALAKTSKAKSAAIILSLWIIMILIRSGFAAMSAARMKA